MTSSTRRMWTDAYASYRRFRRKLRFRVLNPARYCADLLRLRFATGRPPGAIRRLALISDDAAYCSEQQFHPFTRYRAQLRDELNLAVVHLLVEDVLRAPGLLLKPFDVIGLKMTYRMPAAEALRIGQIMRKAFPSKPIVYFDGDDDSCVQWPDLLPFVDLHVKKHVFCGSGDYLKTYAGKSNLHDHAHRVFGHVFTAKDYGNAGEEPLVILSSGPVAADQLHKIHLGYNIALDQKILELHDSLGDDAGTRTKEKDIHFRGSVKTETFTRYFREQVDRILRNLEPEYRLILTNKHVPAEEYYREMLDSKICISPFGFGEICWRDFEAVLCGCLLVKPDMGHLRTVPDIFVPHVTYVPVKWDFSDLESTCRHYLERPEEIGRISTEAQRRLRGYFRDGGFKSSVAEMLARV